MKRERLNSVQDKRKKLKRDLAGANAKALTEQNGQARHMMVLQRIS